MSERVAIVGIGGIFPGARDLDHFWTNIATGVDSAREVPADRWSLPVAQAYAPDGPKPDKVFSTRGCFLDSIPFDSTGLQIDEDLLSRLDPLFRLTLAAGSQAWKSTAGRNIRPERVGLILGNIVLPTVASSRLAEEFFETVYQERLFGRRTENAFRTAPLNRYVAGLPAGLLARTLGIAGGSMTLDAACASSLYAVQLAVRELLAFRADAMLAGGVSRPDPLYTQMGFSQLHALSPSGRCAPFDAKADGLVVGEGAGIVVLKRLSDALRAGDHIHAVITGIGLSNDVDGNLLQPSSEGQLRALHAAYRESGWAPSDIDLIECHGTGTPVGDGVEFASLRELWKGQPSRRNACVIGSVKSNVGHLLTGAGAAGLIKVLLAMKHQTLPPTANFQTPNPRLGIEQSPFLVLAQAEVWEANGPRRAAINGFGFGGINAHLLLEEWQSESPKSQVRGVELEQDFSPRPIAVIGIDAHFGPLETLDEFRECVLGGKSIAPVVAMERFRGIRSSSAPDTAALPLYGLRDLRITKGRFRIPPLELAEILPQQLLMLDVAAGALENAGIDEDRDARKRFGVFIGIGLDLNTTNFHFRWSLTEKAATWARELGLELSDDELADWEESLKSGAGPALSANRTMGALGGIVASRVARELRAGGPSFTISSEETSGLKAVEMAVRALQAGEIDLAIVGAVDINGDIRSLLATDALRPYSRSGISRPFDDAADGAVAGEGAAAVILRRLNDAEANRETIHAVIAGIGSSSSTSGDLLTVSQAAYETAIERAYRDAAIEPASIGYLEAHGSGARDEDNVEISALYRYFGARTTPVTIGSVKADIGHAGAAAGLASLVKSILCLEHGILPSLRHLKNPAQGTEVFALPTTTTHWLRNRDEGPRRAGVSALSIDGSCVHVVLEESPAKAIIDDVSLSQPLGPAADALFLVSGNEPAIWLRELADLDRLATNDSFRSIHELARNWWQQSKSRPLAPRVAIVARDLPGLRKHIQAARVSLTSDIHRRPPPLTSVGGWSYSPDPLGQQGEVAFLFPGSGNHFAGMGRDIATQWPAILRRQDRENAHLRGQILPEVFWNHESLGDAEKDARLLILGQVAVGTIVSDAVRMFGIEPTAVIGYSLGESAGLFATRAWPRRDEMWRRVWDSTLFTEDMSGTCRAARQHLGLRDDEPFEWVAGVIDQPRALVKAAVDKHPGTYLLLINTARESVIGGERLAMDRLLADLSGNFLPLKGVTTVHCDLAIPVREAYRNLHLLDTTPPKGIRFYSGAWRKSYPLSRESAADSIIAQALGTIDYPALIQRAYDDGIRIFVEIGPGNSCTRMISQILAGKPHFVRSACPQTSAPLTAFIQLLAHLAAEGVSLDLNPLYGSDDGVRSLPQTVGDAIVIPIGTRPFEIPDPPAGKPKPTSRPVPQAASPRIPKETAMPLAVPWPPALSSEFAQEEQISTAIANAAGATAAAHDVYLRLAASSADAMIELVAYQTTLMQQMRADTEVRAALFEHAPISSHPSALVELVPERTVFLDRDRCLEYAIGRIGDVLGPQFAPIDTFPTRVRLPDEPLMLVDRILEVEGEPCSLTHGRVVTEHDVLHDGWYLDAGRMPTCIAVEAGQADLFLSGYLGIDFETRGLAVYRLLDAVVTFHRELPIPGEVIHYDIKIERFFRQNDTYLFRFHFEGTVNGEPLLTMTDGCAGFFTQEALEAGKGIVQTALARRSVPGIRPAKWRDFAPMQIESFDERQIELLRHGDLAGAFGAPFANLGLQAPMRLPSGRMKLIDRVTHLDPKGGRHGLGLVRAEADIHPDDWFLTCHFIDDQVMPGTLMYECCLHTLRVFLMRMGWVGEDGEVACQPVPGVASQLKCRGQVLASTQKATYEVSIKEIGYRPEPYVIVDALMYADEKAIVEITNMSLRLTGLDRDQLESLWSSAALPAEVDRKPALYSFEQILAYAIGKPSEAFGELYRIFDEERIIARLPGPPYQFLDRITAVEGEPWKLMAGAMAEGQYDVPHDAWYFTAARQPLMPFAVLLEVALQPCGWLAAYCGSALTSPTDLSFRNLGGSAVQYLPIGPDAGTLTMTSRMTRVSSSGGMIIQNFDFEVLRGRELVYKGDTYFGFFSKQALAEQVGIRDAKRYEPTAKDVSTGRSLAFPEKAPFPEKMLRMIDEIELFAPAGGPAGLGYVRGIKRIDPEEWFFKAHFYQDPVCPGSLGLESFLQLVQFAGVNRWGNGPSGGQPWLWGLTFNTKQRWSYRGQVVPTNAIVTVEVWITAVDDATRTISADGFLLADGKPIYQMNDFSLRASASPAAFEAATGKVSWR